VFDIVTCGDGNYFSFLKHFEGNVFNVYGRYPVIYDLGLEEWQKKSLRSALRHVDIPESYFEYNSHNFIKATHKPRCLKDFLHATENDCLYVDADTVFTSQIRESVFSGAEIAVCPRHVKERKEMHLVNGCLNSGLLYFKNSKEVKLFFDVWIARCQDEDVTDQKALSDLLMEHVDLLCGPTIQYYGKIPVRLLDPAVYNDVSCETGILFHYKNAGRRDWARSKYERMISLQRRHPDLVRLLVSVRRMLLYCSRFILRREVRFMKGA